MNTKLEELEATIEQAQAQIEELKNPKPTKWQPRGEFYALHHSLPTSTAEAAEKATANIRTHNRLLSYVDEFGGDWEADNSLKPAYTVEIDTVDDSYNVREWWNCITLGAVYMSKGCADGLIAKLESGEVVL